MNRFQINSLQTLDIKWKSFWSAGVSLPMNHFQPVGREFEIQMKIIFKHNSLVFDLE